MADARYYIRVRGKVLGPFDLAQLRKQRDRGQLSRFHGQVGVASTTTTSCPLACAVQAK